MNDNCKPIPCELELQSDDRKGKTRFDRFSPGNLTPAQQNLLRLAACDNGYGEVELTPLAISQLQLDIPTSRSHLHFLVPHGRSRFARPE